MEQARWDRVPEQDVEWVKVRDVDACKARLPPVRGEAAYVRNADIRRRMRPDNRAVKRLARDAEP